MEVGNEDFVKVIPELKRLINKYTYIRKDENRKGRRRKFEEDEILQKCYLEFYRLFINGKYSVNDETHFTNIMRQKASHCSRGYFNSIKNWLTYNQKVYLENSERLFFSPIESEIEVNHINTIVNSIEDFTVKRIIQLLMFGYERSEICNELDLKICTYKSKLNRSQIKNKLKSQLL